MIIEIKLSSLLEEVLSRLKYYSGKRAAEAEDYFRFSACKADMGILVRFADESAGWLAAKSRPIWRGFSLVDDSMKFILDITESGYETDSSRAEITSLLRLVLVSYIIYRWLQITGAPEVEKWLTEAENSVMDFVASHRNYGIVKSRPISPI